MSVSPLNLIIQDELHLISGAVGSMVGMYEGALDALYRHEHNGKRVSSKIKPKQNSGFWQEKIGGNKRRDRRVARQLRAKGWSVLRVRECRLKKPDQIIRRIQRMLGRR